MSNRDFAGVASAADYTVPADTGQGVASGASFVDTETFKTAKRCMMVVDGDRAEYAAEHGMQCSVISLLPLECTPVGRLGSGLCACVCTGVCEHMHASAVGVCCKAVARLKPTNYMHGTPPEKQLTPTRKTTYSSGGSR